MNLHFGFKFSDIFLSYYYGYVIIQTSKTKFSLKHLGLNLFAVFNCTEKMLNVTLLNIKSTLNMYRNEILVKIDSSNWPQELPIFLLALLVAASYKVQF
jgi:hypothetical protein